MYTAGESNGLLYFIMQYVPGESLRDVLDREKRIPPARAAVMREAALSLGYVSPEQYDAWIVPLDMTHTG